MKPVLVDSNVLLDLATEDPHWSDWSSEQLERLAEETLLVINPIVYAEVSVGYETVEEVEELLTPDFVLREDLPWEAAFLAGKCFLMYRRRGGSKTAPLPDFYIGAHAAVRDFKLLTRDARRFRSYFPKLEILAP